jgi:hypothetical protein
VVSVPSTAAAAKMVSTQDDAAADSGAICSKICLQLFADLEILHEDVQDERSELNSDSLPRDDFPFWPGVIFSSFTNFFFSIIIIPILIFDGSKDNSTRFYILADHPSSPLPNTPNEGIEERKALIRLEVLPPKAVSQDTTVTISDLLAALRLPVSRIDRRPSTSVPREQYGSTYLVEVMGSERTDGSESSPQRQKGRGDPGKAGIAGLVPWKERVLAAVARVVEREGRADLLGTW